MCAGTDEIRGDVYQLFFEIRERKLMGGFFESHDEDVTNVCFHPTNPDLLATCSTDGLINIWDVQKESEDDALKYILDSDKHRSRSPRDRPDRRRERSRDRQERSRKYDDKDRNRQNYRDQGDSRDSRRYEDQRERYSDRRRH